MLPFHGGAIMNLAFRALEVGLGAVFLGAVAHHVTTLDFKPLAAFALPVLIIYFGFASLQSRPAGRGSPSSPRPMP